MLRKTWQSNSRERKPATCHGAIPSLSPGRYYHGIASIDYQIWVCGGMFSKLTLFSSFSKYLFYRAVKLSSSGPGPGQVEQVQGQRTKTWTWAMH